jgi:hypothetical protein
MHQPCEPLLALRLQGFGLGQSIVGTWGKSGSAPTLRSNKVYLPIMSPSHFASTFAPQTTLFARPMRQGSQQHPKELS